MNIEIGENKDKDKEKEGNEKSKKRKLENSTQNIVSDGEPPLKKHENPVDSNPVLFFRYFL